MGASSEATLSLVLKARNLASREVDGLRGSFSKLGGTLATLGKVGILAVITGLVGVGAALADATKRAAEEQVGIQRMNAALKASVPGFKGNTDAIEKLISQRENLAFSDDELRDSMTTLVTKFHDVKQAQDVQAVAMDVARLKNISLADASQLVAKGMDGNAKVLKQFGLVADEASTKQSILTAIQAKAAGQAEAYGKTAEGSQKAFQIAMDDMLEDVGSGFVPIMTQFFNVLRLKVIPAVRDIIGRVQTWMAQNKPLIDQIKTFAVNVLGQLVTIAGNVVQKISDIIAVIANSKPAMAIITGAFSALSTAIGIVVSLLQKAFSWLEKFMNALSHLSLPDITGITNWIPHFATGGRVPGPAGQPTLAVVHGGERVSTSGSEPAAPPSTGVTITGVSEREIVEMVERGLYFKLKWASPTSAKV